LSLQVASKLVVIIDTYCKVTRRLHLAYHASFNARSKAGENEV